MPYTDVAAALAGDPTAPPYYLSLDGSWKFHCAVMREMKFVVKLRLL